ncbi:MAG: ATP-binding protein [Bryobacter sp.]|nr:ATP-binding protein [Bryobacter sp.]
MLTEQEVLQLCSDLESDRIERTISTKDTDKFCEAITAFSNDLPDHRKPGYLLIGVKDSGELSGLQIDDKFLASLGGIRSDGNIQPMPSLNIGKFSFPGGDVVVIEVFPSEMPPVRYKGRTLIRVGPRKATATESEERRLTEKRDSHARTFDARPCKDASLRDLALDLFKLTYLPNAVASEILEENHRDLDVQLASLRFYDPRTNCPTHAGIMLFGKNPLRFLPSAYIQFLHLDGDTLASDVLQEHRISGDLLSVLREMDLLVDSIVIEKPVEITTLREITVANYPKRALRELLMNAILHRDYESPSPIRFYQFSDRIEIQNPGGLYGDASKDNFPNVNAYRNPILAEAMRVLGYVNAYGRGVIVARSAAAKNGSPDLEFHFETSHTLVILRSRP